MTDLVFDVKAVLATAPARWAALAQTLPSDLLTRAPAPGEWSAMECLHHVIITEGGLIHVRLQQLLAGEDFAGFDPDAPGNKPNASLPAEKLVRSFGELRAASLALLATINEEDLARSVRHLSLGPVTLADFLNEWAAHDLMHIVQAERALMQPFILFSGPWRRYFADHEAKAQ